MPPAAGRVLAGRYRLVAPIARGGMAEVWEGHDEVLSRPVAVKVLQAHLAADGVFLERFRREAVTAARLAHPGIVATFDTGFDDGTAFIVMELVRGRNLRQWLDSYGRLEPWQAVGVARQMADALSYAHQAGLVHRDVKPANVLLIEDEWGGLRVKITDFGIAKAGIDMGADLTRTGMVLGTPKYLSPEQIRGFDPDPRADLYSLGVVLYEMLVGAPPYAGETEMATALAHLGDKVPKPSTSVRHIPGGLDRVVVDLLAKSPDKRIGSAAELRRRLDALGPLGPPAGARPGTAPAVTPGGAGGGAPGGARRGSWRRSGPPPVGLAPVPSQGRPPLPRPAPAPTPAGGPDPAGVHTVVEPAGAGPPTTAIPVGGSSSSPTTTIPAVNATGGYSSAQPPPPPPASRAVAGPTAGSAVPGPTAGGSAGPGSAGPGPRAAGSPVPGTAVPDATVAGATVLDAAAAAPAAAGPFAAPRPAGNGGFAPTDLDTDQFAPASRRPRPAHARRFRRSERTAGLVVLVLVLVGAVVAGVLLATGGAKHKATPATATPPAKTAVPIAAVQVYLDVAGHTLDNPSQTPLTFDGNPATFWSTDQYRTPTFGNLYPGIGLVIQLKTPAALATLTVTSPTVGWAASTYVSTVDVPTGQPVTGWGTPTATRSDIAGNTTFSLAGRTGGYVLLWITNLGRADRAEVAELAVTGR
jgi:tRNA A-37 threonylcarbamoyl transferase component Bud32